MEKYLQVNNTDKSSKMSPCTWYLVKLTTIPAWQSNRERNEKKREKERRVFGVHIWLVSSGREAQLVPKGIGQLLMEALGMSAARPPIHGREKKTDRSIDSLREAEADEEDLQGRGTGSFLSSRASQPYRAAKRVLRERLRFSQQRTKTRLRKRCENIIRGLAWRKGSTRRVCQSVTLCNRPEVKGAISRTRICVHRLTFGNFPREQIEVISRDFFFFFFYLIKISKRI